MGVLFWEDGVTYRERCEINPYEERYDNIALKRQTAFGPWLVMGLGIILVLFLAYLVYSNLLVPPAALSSPERSLRIIAESATAMAMTLPEPLNQQHLQQLGVAGRTVPQSRAANALLGGQGPASPLGLVAAPPRDTPELRTSAAVVAR